MSLTILENLEIVASFKIAGFSVHMLRLVAHLETAEPSRLQNPHRHRRQDKTHNLQHVDDQTWTSGIYL